MPDTPPERGSVNHHPYTLAELRQQLLEAQRQGLDREYIAKIEADIAMFDPGDRGRL